MISTLNRATDAAQISPQKEKLKETTHTSVLPDGTLVINIKMRQSLPDGSLLTKTRIEPFATKWVHVIEIKKTRRINYGGGLSFTTTTQKESLENSPITYTHALSGGSCITKKKP